MKLNNKNTERGGENVYVLCVDLRLKSTAI